MHGLCLSDYRTGHRETNCVRDWLFTRGRRNVYAGFCDLQGRDRIREFSAIKASCYCSSSPNRAVGKA